MKQMIKVMAFGLVSIVDIGYTANDQTTVAVETSKPQQPLTSEQKTSLATEQEKWHYLRGQLSFEVGDVTSLSRRAGEIVNDLRWLLDWEGSFLVLCAWIYFSETLMRMNRAQVLFGILSLSPIGYVVSDYILKQLSDFLEDKPYVCMQALEKFLQSWSTVHKAQAPQAVQAIFDELYADTQEHEGELTMIDEEQAKKIVEGVIVTALLVEAVR